MHRVCQRDSALILHGWMYSVNAYYPALVPLIKWYKGIFYSTSIDHFYFNPKHYMEETIHFLRVERCYIYFCACLQVWVPMFRSAGFVKDFVSCTCWLYCKVANIRRAVFTICWWNTNSTHRRIISLNNITHTDVNWLYI